MGTPRRSRRRRRLAALLLGTTVLVSCGGDDEQRVAPYDVTPVPAVPDRTAVPTDGTLPDGQYWTEGFGIGAEEGRLTATLVQAFFGPACVEELGADGCTTEPGVDDDPAIEVVVDLAEVLLVSVVDDDRRNYSIPATELARLVAGEVPDPNAPEGYVFGDDPFLLTVRDGVVTEVAQIWVG